MLWAGPASVVGLVLSPFFARRFLVGPLLVCEGASWPARLGWRYKAITFGHVVLGVERLDQATLEHERVHVSQYEIWGPLLVPAYLLASLLVVLRGRHFYRDNPFETAARTPERQARLSDVALAEEQRARRDQRDGIPGQRDEGPRPRMREHEALPGHE